MPGPYGEADPWGEPPGPLRTSGTATLALAAGVLSYFCLFGVGGALAIVLGWVAHGEVQRSEGRLTGKGLASTAIGLGIGNLVLSVVALGALVAFAVRPAPPSAAATAAPSPPLRYPAPPAVAAPRVPPAAPQAEVAEAAPTLPSLPPHVGQISIVEATSAGGSLETQLLTQLASAGKAGELLLLWTVKPDCEPCEALGHALPDARMQRSLAKVRLVRADAGVFRRELQQLGVPSDAVPGFTLLDTHAHARDHIHGGEWDADIPANIAPILGKFMRNSLIERRYPWARPLREGETTL